jgi:hypothetical protein
MVATTRPAARRLNIDSPARWDAALKRAIGKGLRLFQHDATGQWFCSASDGQSLYAVGHYTCECAAALANDPVCQHRALFREACRADDQEVERLLAEQETGMTDAELERLLNEPAIAYDPAAVERMLDARVPTFDEAGEMTVLVASGTGTVRNLPEPETECQDCHGSGWSRMYTGFGMSDWISARCSCPAGRAVRSIA